uniref:Uncharacterized protein n=1 Tax=uncultured marine virus TaxID=186617 RepID=A0A0F7L8H9_9VIRU|nr:hypothetical protein [uncultured marine virus]
MFIFTPIPQFLDNVNDGNPGGLILLPFALVFSTLIACGSVCCGFLICVLFSLIVNTCLVRSPLRCATINTRSLF